MRQQEILSFMKIKDINKYINDVLDGDIRAKRVSSLANATMGIMTGASLAISMIGQALAQARGLLTKHAIKQVDRLLSNQGIDVWDLFRHWVPQVVGARQGIVVAMDWTDFDANGQATLALSLITRHGRATPLLWLTALKDELKDQRNDFEDVCLARLAAVLPPGVRVTILADRGFGDHKLFDFLKELGFDYVIRFRQNIHVTDETGETRTAAEWVGKGGRARKLAAARVTASARYQVGAVVCVQAKDMKDAWCLATSLADATSREVIDLYAKRWTIEPGFRAIEGGRDFLALNGWQREGLQAIVGHGGCGTSGAGKDDVSTTKSYAISELYATFASHFQAFGE